MGAGGNGVAGMPKYDANAERAADVYHRVPLPVKERDSAGSDIAGRTGYSDPDEGEPRIHLQVPVCADPWQSPRRLHRRPSTKRVSRNHRGSRYRRFNSDEEFTISDRVKLDERSAAGYSHSMVPGGLLVMSSTTRLTSGTSLVIRVEMRSSTS